MGPSPIILMIPAPLLFLTLAFQDIITPGCDLFHSWRPLMLRLPSHLGNCNSCVHEPSQLFGRAAPGFFCASRPRHILPPDFAIPACRSQSGFVFGLPPPSLICKIDCFTFVCLSTVSPGLDFPSTNPFSTSIAPCRSAFLSGINCGCVDF